MLTILLSWVIIAFILFTFGDMLITFYNRICKRKEEYNFTDKILLGLCFLMIPLSIWSLWLPSNHIFLVTISFIGIGYWSVNYRKGRQVYIQIIKSNIKALSLAEKVSIIIFILASLFFFTWQQEVYDSAFYHYQNIRWNEEFAVVPGVANIDDRFGFNSNYFLLSAIFSFRFLFGEAIYTLQSLIVIIIGLWILHELFKSRYDIKLLIIFCAYILLFWVSIYFLGNTSTDILPNFIAFYIIARIILYPNLLKQNYLIGIVLSVFLLTCKLSFFPLGFISLYLIFYLIKEKKYKVIAFIFAISFLIILPWLIRNVIISGYLIYPLYQIDLFNFDWKVPLEVAIKEKDYIFAIGYYFLRTALRYPDMSIRDPLAINILTDIIYMLTFVSLLTITYLIIKKRKQTGIHIYLLFSIFIISIIVWTTGGPDIRFISGILCAAIFVGGIQLLNDKKKYLTILTKVIYCVFITSILLYAGSQYYNFSTKIKEEKIIPIKYSLLKPFSVKDQQRVKGINATESYKAYAINNNLFIWVGSDLPYDMTLPASIHSHYSKFLPIECLETRGNTIEKGFRAKDKCR
ncbi:MAG: LIC_10190 family membrane protein [Dysgonomonas sp.]